MAVFEQRTELSEALARCCVIDHVDVGELFYPSIVDAGALEIPTETRLQRFCGKVTSRGQRLEFGIFMAAVRHYLYAVLFLRDIEAQVLAPKFYEHGENGQRRTDEE